MGKYLLSRTQSGSLGRLNGWPSRQYSGLVDGGENAEKDRWLQCIDGRQVVAVNKGQEKSWQSPEALLVQRLKGRNFDIYRLDVDVDMKGGFTGTEQLLIENGQDADTGL